MSNKGAPKLSPEARKIALDRMWKDLLTPRSQPQVVVKSDQKETVNDRGC